MICLEHVRSYLSEVLPIPGLLVLVKTLTVHERGRQRGCLQEKKNKQQGSFKSSVQTT